MLRSTSQHPPPQTCLRLPLAPMVSPELPNMGCVFQDPSHQTPGKAPATTVSSLAPSSPRHLESPSSLGSVSWTHHTTELLTASTPAVLSQEVGVAPVGWTFPLCSLQLVSITCPAPAVPSSITLTCLLHSPEPVLWASLVLEWLAQCLLHNCGRREGGGREGRKERKQG